MKDLSFLKQNLLIHRGIQDEENRIIENTILSFQEAMKYNYGIELDVHILKDGEVVVFHDDNLERMAGIKRKIKELSYEDIRKIRLLGTENFIPKLSEVLDLVKGRVPLLIELKYDVKVGRLEKKVVELLENYEGNYAIQSFQPLTIRWFYKNKPTIVRGQLYSDNKIGYVIKNFIFNRIGKPDFISYNIKDLNRARTKKIRKKKLLLGWTVKTRKEYEEIRTFYDNLICENFIIKGEEKNE